MTKKIRGSLVMIFIAALILVQLNPSHAQERLRISWSGNSVAQTPIWVMQERKLLEKHGISAEIISIGGSPTAVQSLLAGELDVAVVGNPALVSSRLAGADTVMIATLVPTFVDHIITQPTITGVQQLKGKTGAINRVGSTSDLGLRLALKKLGLDPDNDVKIIGVGGNPDRFAALARGLVQFTLISEPFIGEAEKLGLRDLLDIGSLKIPFHWNAAITRESTINSKKPAMERFVRATVEAIHLIKTDKEMTKATVSKYLHFTDPEGLERAYRAWGAIFPEAPYPNPEGVKTMLDDLAPRNPKAAAADPKSFVNASFVQQLEKSGFIRQLYRR